MNSLMREIYENVPFFWRNQAREEMSLTSPNR